MKQANKNLMRMLPWLALLLFAAQINSSTRTGKAATGAKVNKKNIQAEEDQEIEQIAMQRAKDRAHAARWSLEIAIFLFAVVIIIVILSLQQVGLEVVAPIAVFGLAMVWLCGWRQGNQMYERFYDEELARLKYEQIKTNEETVEEIVQNAILKRFR